MGRIEKSQGLAPPAVRKDARAKQARQIINKTIPAILHSNSKAMQGAEGSLLIVNPGPCTLDIDRIDGGNDRDDASYVQRKGQGRRKLKHNKQILTESNNPTLNQSKQRQDPQSSAEFSSAQLSLPKARKEIAIKVVWTDSLSAAAALTTPSRLNKKQRNVCVLNMASPLRPGGGVLNGATSQEEFLCARTTLLPSLKESFYRLPEIGGIFTQNVLVFRNSRPLHDPLGEIPIAERFWIDVISAGMLRFPQLQGENEDEKHWSPGDYALAEAKMRAVLRIVSQCNVNKLVLGAWGCGAYGNPVQDVAETWRKVLITDNSKTEDHNVWYSIDEVTFAISNRAMAEEFATIFGKPIEMSSNSVAGSEAEEGEDDKVSEDLQAQIKQLECRISSVQIPQLKSSLELILEKLKAQLKLQESEVADADDDSGSDGKSKIPKDKDDVLSSNTTNLNLEAQAKQSHLSISEAEA